MHRKEHVVAHAPGIFNVQTRLARTSLENVIRSNMPRCALCSEFGLAAQFADSSKDYRSTRRLAPHNDRTKKRTSRQLSIYNTNRHSLLHELRDQGVVTPWVSPDLAIQWRAGTIFLLMFGLHLSNLQSSTSSHYLRPH